MWRLSGFWSCKEIVLEPESIPAWVLDQAEQWFAEQTDLQPAAMICAEIWNATGKYERRSAKEWLGTPGEDDEAEQSPEQLMFAMETIAAGRMVVVDE